jgi:hypothetical protein
MDIKRHKVVRKIWLNKKKYIEIVLKCFNMQDSKLVKVSIPVGERLIVEDCPKTHEEIEEMTHVPYANVFGSLMYAMVYTRLDIAHVVGVLRRYMFTPEREH